MTKLWRCIPSCIDEPSGEVLCYTVSAEKLAGNSARDAAVLMCGYEKRWWPIADWFHPDGSYRDIRIELT